MQSAVLAGPTKIVIEEHVCPEPSTDEVLIKVENVAICGSDQDRFWYQVDDFPKPVVFGHEFSGYVASVHPSVKSLELGQPVTVAPLYNCGKCEFCLSGNENLCQERSRFGFDIDGALQEFVNIPEYRVFPVPRNLSMAEASLVEPLAVAYHAIRIAGFNREGMTVILGAGAIGLLIAQIWRALGNKHIRVVDINPDRLLIANKLGFQSWTSILENQTISTLFEASGSSNAFSNWASGLAPGGRAVVVGKLNKDVRLDWVNLLRKEAEIVTSRYFTIKDFEESLRLIEKVQVELNPLIGTVLPFNSLAHKDGKYVMEKAKQVVRLVIQI